MTIGEKIVKLRKQAGYSQEAFSEKLGLSRQAVSKWENGTAQPTSDNLAQIAKLFDVPLSALLDDEDISIGQPQDILQSAPQQTKNKTGVILSISVIILAISVLIQGITIGSLRQDISNAKSQINEITYLRNELNSLRSYIYSLPGSYISNNENFTDYHYEITDYDYKTDTATLSFYVVPTDYTRNTQAKIVIKGAKDSYSTDAVMENDIFTAEVDVKCEDNMSVYLYLTDNGSTRSFILDYLSNPNEDFVIIIEDCTADISPAYTIEKDGSVLVDTVVSCAYRYSDSRMPLKAVIRIWAEDKDSSVAIMLKELPFESIMDSDDMVVEGTISRDSAVISVADSKVIASQAIYEEIYDDYIKTDSKIYFEIILADYAGKEFSSGPFI